MLNALFVACLALGTSNAIADDVVEAAARERDDTGDASLRERIESGLSPSMLRFLGYAAITAPMTAWALLGAVYSGVASSLCGIGCGGTLYGCMASSWGMFPNQPATSLAYASMAMGFVGLVMIGGGVAWTVLWALVAGAFSAAGAGGFQLLEPAKESVRTRSKSSLGRGGWLGARVLGAWFAAVATSVAMLFVNYAAMAIAGTLLGLVVNVVMTNVSSRSTMGAPTLTNADTFAVIAIAGWVALGAFSLATLQPFVPLAVFAAVTMLWRPERWFGGEDDDVLKRR